MSLNFDLLFLWLFNSQIFSYWELTFTNCKTNNLYFLEKLLLFRMSRLNRQSQLNKWLNWCKKQEANLIYAFCVIFFMSITFMSIYWLILIIIWNINRSYVQVGKRKNKSIKISWSHHLFRNSINFAKVVHPKLIKMPWSQKSK